jgi:uncharacterized membrane protein YccC
MKQDHQVRKKQTLREAQRGAQRIQAHQYVRKGRTQTNPRQSKYKKAKLKMMKMQERMGPGHHLSSELWLRYRNMFQRFNHNTVRMYKHWLIMCSRTITK